MDVVEAIKGVLLTDFTAADRMEGVGDNCFKKVKEESVSMSFEEELTNQEFEESNADENVETCMLGMKAEAFDFDNNTTQKASGSMELQRVSVDQLVTMFDYFDQQPHLARGVSTGVGSQHEVDRLWAALAKRLNHKGKARKNGHQWKKYWSTLKCRIKKKAAALRAGAGGALSVLERRALALLGDDMAVYQSAPHWSKLKWRIKKKAASVRAGAGGKLSVLERRVMTLLGDDMSVYQSASESKPEIVNPISRSPSPRVDEDDFSWPSEEEVFTKADSPPPTPKRARRSGGVRGRPARSRNASQVSGGSSFEPWLVALERRRVAAEETMAQAMKTMADAALLNAQTLRLCAQAGIQLRASNGRARESGAQ